MIPSLDVFRVLLTGSNESVERPESTRRILVGAPNSYVVRNWVATGLADLLLRRFGVDTIFISHFSDATFRSPQGIQFENHCVPLQRHRGKDWPAGYPVWYRTLAYLRLRLTAQEIPNGGGQLLAFSRMRGPLTALLRAVRYAFPRQSPRRSLVRRALPRVRPAAALYRELVEAIQPGCVVVGTPGITAFDQLLTIAGRRAGVPVACVVNSWDNLVSRGPMIQRPDLLLVWNDCMRDQAIRVHDFPPERIRIVGSLQFSPYARQVAQEEQSALRRRLQIPGRDPYMLYLTSAEVPDYEAEDIHELIRRLGPSEFGRLPLVIRVHPQAGSQVFEVFESERVRIDRPPSLATSGENGDGFGLTQIRDMAALLQGAQVVFASAGTTALLEAAIFDRPMVQLRWMDALPRKHRAQVDRVRDYQSYIHIRDLDGAGCRLFCDDPATLVGGIREILGSSGAFAERRREAVERLVTTPVGDAPRRVAQALRNEVPALNNGPKRKEARRVKR